MYRWNFGMLPHFSKINGSAIHHAATVHICVCCQRQWKFKTNMLLVLVLLLLLSLDTLVLQVHSIRQHQLPTAVWHCQHSHDLVSHM
jgi:hypothetical protein